MSKAFTLCCKLDEAKALREDVAFLQGVKVLLTKEKCCHRAEAQRPGDGGTGGDGQALPRGGVTWG